MVVRIFGMLLLCVLSVSSVYAVELDQDDDGKIDAAYLPTVSLVQDGDPAEPFAGQMWWNNSTNQLKVAGALGIYEFNATSMVAWDTTPTAFTFTDVTGADTSTIYTSNAITVAGINWPAAISVSGDATAKYSINNATATSTNGTVELGDEVRAVVTSSASGSTAVNATVTIGGVSDVYSVTTAVGPLVDEDFEGTGTPSGWTKTTDINFDYTSSPIAGSQSLYAPSTGDGQNAYVSFSGITGASELSFAMKTDNVQSSSVGYILLKGSGTTVYFVGFRKDFVLIRGGTTEDAASFTFSNNTVYYFWLEFNPTLKTASLFVSTSSTKPGSATASVTGNQSVTSIDSVYFLGPAYTGSNTVYDSVVLR